MGEHQVLYCHDCKVQRDIDKLKLPRIDFKDEYDGSYFDDQYTMYWAMSVLEFIESHRNCKIELAGEYTNDLWMDQEADYEENPFEYEDFVERDNE